MESNELARQLRISLPVSLAQQCLKRLLGDNKGKNLSLSSKDRAIEPDEPSGEGCSPGALLATQPTHQRLDRYTILGTLGRGGMGVVLDAFDGMLNRKVAVKLLHRDIAGRHTARLVREAKALAKLSHPNVVQVYEVGTVREQYFIAMERVQGRTLEDWCEQQHHPWHRCVQIYLHAGKGLAAAHAAGLVHRDFKPSNCIIDDNGEVKVLDFGLVRNLAIDKADGDSRDGGTRGLEPKAAEKGGLDEALTATGTLLGTLAYMPLEQLRGQAVDARADQFSFCVSLYEAIYGERPFTGKTVDQLMAALDAGEISLPPGYTDVPVRLRRILQRGLASRPEDRWPSMAELLDELTRIVRPRWTGQATSLVLGFLLVYFSLDGLALAQNWKLELPWRVFINWGKSCAGYFYTPVLVVFLWLHITTMRQQCYGVEYKRVRRRLWAIFTRLITCLSLYISIFDFRFFWLFSGLTVAAVVKHGLKRYLFDTLFALGALAAFVSLVGLICSTPYGVPLVALGEFLLIRHIVRTSDPLSTYLWSPDLPAELDRLLVLAPLVIPVTVQVALLRKVLNYTVFIKDTSVPIARGFWEHLTIYMPPEVMLNDDFRFMQQVTFWPFWSPWLYMMLSFFGVLLFVEGLVIFCPRKANAKWWP